jgi:hypothetical protein
VSAVADLFPAGAGVGEHDPLACGEFGLFDIVDCHCGDPPTIIVVQAPFVFLHGRRHYVVWWGVRHRRNIARIREKSSYDLWAIRQEA